MYAIIDYSNETVYVEKTRKAILKKKKELISTDMSEIFDLALNNNSFKIDVYHLHLYPNYINPYPWTLESPTCATNKVVVDNVNNGMQSKPYNTNIGYPAINA